MPLTEDLAEKKAELRIQFRKYRLGLSDMQRYIRSNAMVKKILALPQYQQADRILVYLSTQEEIDTRVLVAHALLSGKAVAVPRCCSGGSRKMDFCAFKDYRELVTGSYGILEPSPQTPALDIEEFSSAFCLVPALGADLQGQRLGYGGGYYDRFLENFLGTAAVMVYDECLVTRLPSQVTDIPVSYIITPSRTLKVNEDQGDALQF